MADQDIEKAPTDSKERLKALREERSSMIERNKELLKKQNSDSGLIKKGLKDLSDEDKRIVGAYANEVAQKLENSVNEKFESIYRKELDEKLQKEN